MKSVAANTVAGKVLFRLRRSQAVSLRFGEDLMFNYMLQCLVDAARERISGNPVSD
jgi:hypothetical protein